MTAQHLHPSDRSRVPTSRDAQGAAIGRQAKAVAGPTDRVYVNDRDRHDLGWSQAVDFAAVLAAVTEGQPVQTPLSRLVGAKGYHPGGLVDGMYRTGDAR